MDAKDTRKLDRINKKMNKINDICTMVNSSDQEMVLLGIQLAEKLFKIKGSGGWKFTSVSGQLTWSANSVVKAKLASEAYVLGTKTAEIIQKQNRYGKEKNDSRDREKDRQHATS